MLKSTTRLLILSMAVLGSCSSQQPCPPCPPAPVVDIPDLPPKESLPPWEDIPCGYALCTDAAGRAAIDEQFKIFRADANGCRASWEKMQKRYGGPR